MRILLLILAVSLFSCGRDIVKTEYVPVEVPSGGSGQDPSDSGGDPGSGSGDDRPSYQETQALLVTYCESCHASARFMGSERALKESSVKDRVRSGNMPPSNANRKLPDAERRKILSFF